MCVPEDTHVQAYCVYIYVHTCCGCTHTDICVMLTCMCIVWVDACVRAHGCASTGVHGCVLMAVHVHVWVCGHVCMYMCIYLCVQGDKLRPLVEHRAPHPRCAPSRPASKCLSQQQGQYPVSPGYGPGRTTIWGPTSHRRAEGQVFLGHPGMLPLYVVSF